MPEFDFNYTLDDVPVKKMKPGPNVRKDPDEAGLQPLGESLLVRQLQPVILDPEFFIIDGWRRWLAAQRVAIETLKAIVTDRPLTKKELQIAQLMMSVHHCDITGGELYVGCYELLQTYPNLLAKDVAQHVKLSPSMMTRVLSPSKCIEPVRQALMENRIGLSHCYEISKVPEDQQLALLELKLNDGASRDELGRQRRKPKRRRNGSSVKATRIAIPLPDNVMVVIGGPGLTTDSVMSACAAIQKEAKRAVEKNQNIKTFEAIMRDRLKAGA